jgi:hypothetical protein
VKVILVPHPTIGALPIATVNVWLEDNEIHEVGVGYELGFVTIGPAENT